MDFEEILKRYKGKRFYKEKDRGIVPILDTAYGAVIERFESYLYDIQITCYDSAQLDNLLKKLTTYVHD